MPFAYFIALIATVIVAGGLTVWLGYAAGAAALVPVMIVAMSLRVWLARR